MVWVIIAVLAVLAVIAVVTAVRAEKRRRSTELRHHFGREYERTVDETGDRRAAESELAERAKRRRKWEIRDLDPETRERYAEWWEEAQRHFVDRPHMAIARADELVTEVMSRRGYPVSDDFERRAADVSVDHPEVVERYRAAHDISQRSAAGRATTEDLRQAMVHFRALFAELLAPSDRETVSTGRSA